MKRISGILSKQLNKILNKEDTNTSFLEEELLSIKELKIAKRDLPYLDYFEDLESAIIDSFPSITNEDIEYMSSRLKKLKSLKIKEQNALFSIDLNGFSNLKNLCLIHNDNLCNIVNLRKLDRLTFYNNKDFNDIEWLASYLFDNKDCIATIDITYYFPILNYFNDNSANLFDLKRMVWIETIGLRKYLNYEYSNDEIESLMNHLSFIASKYIYESDSEIEKFCVLYNWAINNLKFVNEDDPDGENLSLISNINKVFSYGRGGRLTLAKAFQMLLSFAGINSSVVYSMGATDVIGYYNDEKVCSLLGESDYAVLRVNIDNKNYYCDIAWDAFINFHGFFDKLRFFLFSKDELRIRHKFVGEGNIDSSYSYHGDDCDELIDFAKDRVKEVDEMFDDIERLNPDITGKELNMAILKLKINDLKNDINEFDLNSVEYKNGILDLMKLEEEVDLLSSEILKLEKEKDKIVESYSNLLIKRYISEDSFSNLDELKKILSKKKDSVLISKYLYKILEISLKTKTA